MKIRLKRDWRNLKAGHDLDVPSGQAQVMVERGFAEYADEALHAAPMNRMMQASKPARKARPSAA